MSDNIMPTNDQQNEDRPPTAIVPRVTPMLANSEPVVEVSFGELWRILMKRKRIPLCSHVRLLRSRSCLLFDRNAEIRVHLDDPIQ